MDCWGFGFVNGRPPIETTNEKDAEHGLVHLDDLPCSPDTEVHDPPRSGPCGSNAEAQFPHGLAKDCAGIRQEIWALKAREVVVLGFFCEIARSANWLLRAFAAPNLPGGPLSESRKPDLLRKEKPRLAVIDCMPSRGPNWQHTELV